MEKKNLKDRQPIKIFSVGVTESVNHSDNLSVSLPCSDVMAVIMTRPAVLMSDWTWVAEPALHPWQEKHTKKMTPLLKLEYSTLSAQM